MTYFSKPWITGLLITLLAPSLVHANTYQALTSISDAARAFILQHTPGGGRVQAEIGALDPRLRLPACTESLQAFSPPGSHTTGITSVGVRCQKPKPWSLYVPVNVKIFTPVLTASHSMARGSRVTAQDIQSVEMNITTLPSGYFGTPEQILNKILKRPLGTGEVFSPNTLEAPHLVRRGERVTLLAESGGMQIRATGKALMDGSEGAVIQVRNLSSQRIVEGVVAATGIVKVAM